MNLNQENKQDILIHTFSTSIFTLYSSFIQFNDVSIDSANSMHDISIVQSRNLRHLIWMNSTYPREIFVILLLQNIWKKIKLDFSGFFAGEKIVQLVLSTGESLILWCHVSWNLSLMCLVVEVIQIIDTRWSLIWWRFRA